MSLIPLFEVEDIVYFEDVTQTKEDYYNDCSDREWCPIFNSINKKTLTINQLEQDYGKSYHDSTQSQKSFKAMVMLVSKKDLAQSEIEPLFLKTSI